MTPVTVVGSTPGYGGRAGSFCIGKRTGRYGSTRGPPGKGSRRTCLGSLGLHPRSVSWARRASRRRVPPVGGRNVQVSSSFLMGTHLQVVAGSGCTGLWSPACS